MNIVLLFEDDFIDDRSACLRGRRLQHIIDVHQANINDTLAVGLLNGKLGTGVITRINDQSLTMCVEFSQKPPPPLPLTLILALPRPKMLKRILQTCAAMGVKKILLINSYRVEKSFWQTPVLKPDMIKAQLILGLEQAKDTLLPEVILENRFKPFVEDRLAEFCQNKLSLVAHPGSPSQCPEKITQETVLAIGPEGGFIDYELEKLSTIGFQTVHLGDRILRVENAIPVALAKLFY